MALKVQESNYGQIVSWGNYGEFHIRSPYVPGSSIPIKGFYQVKEDPRWATYLWRIAGLPTNWYGA